MELWYSVRNVMHNLLHQHKYLKRELEEMIICADRWPWGKAAVHYRPHAHAPWQELSMEEFLAKLEQYGYVHSDFQRSEL